MGAELHIKLLALFNQNFDNCIIAKYWICQDQVHKLLKNFLQLNISILFEISILIHILNFRVNWIINVLFPILLFHQELTTFLLSILLCTQFTMILVYNSKLTSCQIMLNLHIVTKGQWWIVRKLIIILVKWNLLWKRDQITWRMCLVICTCSHI